MRGFKDLARDFGTGVTNFASDPKKMGLLVGAIGATIALYYGIPVATRYIEARLNQPSIISETSRTSWLGSKTKKANVKLANLILDQETQARLLSVVERVTTARVNGDNLFNILLYGAPGTGKTMFAKALAYASGLDYAIMSGSEFTKITDTNVAIGEFQKLMKWAEASDKGLVIFIDEAESFLSDRRLPTTTKWSQDMLNAFLAAVPKPTDKKVMFVFATNHPFKLDKAVLSRVGERVEFKLPGLVERTKILKLYLDIFTKNKAVTLAPEVEKDLTGLANELDGISPREIEYIAEKMVQLAKQKPRTNPKDSYLITKEIAESVTKIMKAEIAEAKKWDDEQQVYVDQLVATRS